MKVIVTVRAGQDGVRYEQAIVGSNVEYSVMLAAPTDLVKGQLMPVTFKAKVQPDEGDFRSLVDILSEAIEHGRANPDHGGNCSCMDPFIREIKSQVEGLIPTSAEVPEWEKRMDTRWRVVYLLNAATRYL